MPCGPHCCFPSHLIALRHPPPLLPGTLVKHLEPRCPPASPTALTIQALPVLSQPLLPAGGPPPALCSALLPKVQHPLRPISNMPSVHPEEMPAGYVMRNHLHHEPPAPSSKFLAVLMHFLSCGSKFLYLPPITLHCFLLSALGCSQARVCPSSVCDPKDRR